MAFDLSKPAEVEEAAAGDTVNVLFHRPATVVAVNWIILKWCYEKAGLEKPRFFKQKNRFLVFERF